MTDSLEKKDFDNFISHVLHVLNVGISRFAGKHQLALIAKLGSECYLYDPTNLCQLIGIQAIKSQSALEKNCEEKNVFCHISESKIEPTVLIWLVKLQPSTDCEGIIKTWLTGASNILVACWQKNLVARFSTTFAIETLQYYVVDAIRAYIVLENKGNTTYKDFPLRGVLDCLLHLSRALEEGHSPSGSITFMANSSAKILEFADEILLSDSKHVGKLFPLSKGNATIVSNGNTIDGVALMEPPNHLLKADFKSGAGTIIMNNRNICRIVSNEFRSSLKPVADILKVVLADELSAEEQAKVADIVKAAEENKFGCTLVLDPKETLQKLSGHYLSEPALDTELVAGMAKVDGATLIDSKGAIRAFGCILDGTAGENERLARGARYNSARRFSLAHSNSSIIIIVVSSDGPLSIFKEGAEIYSDPWSYNLKRLDDYGEKITGVATNDFSIQGQI